MRTAKGAGVLAAWFTQLPDVAYQTRSVDVLEEQYTGGCSLCAQQVAAIADGIGDGHQLKGGVRYSAPIYEELHGQSAIVIVYWYFKERTLLDANDEVIFHSEKSHGRYFFTLSWDSDRWVINDMELAQ